MPVNTGDKSVTQPASASVTRLPVAAGLGAAGVSAPTVTILADDARRLVAAADVAAEHHAAMVDATPTLTGTDTLDVMAAAGVIDPDTLAVSVDLQAAISRVAAAVGPWPEPIAA